MIGLGLLFSVATHCIVVWKYVGEFRCFGPGDLGQGAVLVLVILVRGLKLHVCNKVPALGFATSDETRSQVVCMVRYSCSN